MSKIGTIESVWRYPVKSLAGENLSEAFVGYPGLFGDRVYAFTSKAAPPIFPYFTARTRPDMLRYKPRFRTGRSLPETWPEIEAAEVPVTPVVSTPPPAEVEVEMPDGRLIALDDPALSAELGQDQPLELIQSDRVIADCSPISLISMQTITQLSEELGSALDKRRFRANFYLDLDNGRGFGEDGFIGRTLRIGDKASVKVMERDPRCAMIALDPDSAERNKEILRLVSKQHENMAGVYGVVLTEGVVRPGNVVELVD